MSLARAVAAAQLVLLAAALGARAGVARASPPRPALRYGDPAAASDRPALALRAEAFAVRLAARNPGGDGVTLSADGRLAQALERMLPRWPASGPPVGGLTEQALWLTGIVEPTPYLLTMHVSAGATDDVEPQLERVLPRELGTGRYRRVAVALMPLPDRSSRLVLALQESFVELSPVPRALAAGGRARVEGRLLPPYRQPQVYVAAPDGKVATLEVALRDGGFRAELRCGARAGPYQVEVAGEDRLGHAVLANFPVYCGVAAPGDVSPAAAPAPEPRAGAGDEPSRDRLRAEAEARLLEALQHDRAAARLAPLVADSRLSALARAHSTDMRDHRFFGHLSPSTGSAMDRAVHAGVRPVRVRENLGRASSAIEIERGLMGSPSHRANILSDDVDRVGIGVAIGALDPASGTPDLFATQLFARLPASFDAARDTAALRGRLQALRREAGVRALAADAALDRVARMAALALAGAGGAAAAEVVVSQALPSLGARFKWVRRVSGKVVDVSQLDRNAAFEERTATHAGFAAAAGPPEPTGDVPIFLVVMLAARH